MELQEVLKYLFVTIKRAGRYCLPTLGYLSLQNSFYRFTILITVARAKHARHIAIAYERMSACFPVALARKQRLFSLKLKNSITQI